MTHQKALSIKEKIGYSLGDLSANLVFQTLITYRLFLHRFYGLNSEDATAIIFIVGTVAAFGFNLLLVLADRTNSRWGKFRPWICGQQFHWVLPQF